MSEGHEAPRFATQLALCDDDVLMSIGLLCANTIGIEYNSEKDVAMFVGKSMVGYQNKMSTGLPEYEASCLRNVTHLAYVLCTEGSLQYRA